MKKAGTAKKPITDERAIVREEPTAKERATSLEEPIERERPYVFHEKGDMAYWADMSFKAERVRISPFLRIGALEKVGQKSPETETLFEKALDLETYVDRRLAEYMVAHPTWSWGNLIKGIGKENLAKVVGLIEAFGRYYDAGDPMIPVFARQRPVEKYLMVVKGDVVEKEGIWVAGIERLATVSKLWKYAGMSVVDGHSQRRVAGEKLGFNADLRMALFRLATSLMRQQGIWYTGGLKEGQARGYLGHKEVIRSMKLTQGFSLAPTPKGRECKTCNIVVTEKKTFHCPQCGEKLTPKREPTGVLFEGHLHMMALRRMIKDFLLCLWLVWRTAEGLPVPEPYEARLEDHEYKPIDPYAMLDR